MLTTDKQKEVELYGHLLTGEETSLRLAKDARRKYLKAKFRPSLEAVIGDYGDNITDVCRAVVLGEAIRLGIVKDEKLIARHTAYITAMLTGYGGAESVIATLEQAQSGLNQHLVAGYYKAVQDIEAAKTEDDVRMVDLPGEPTGEEKEPIAEKSL
jgi:hypothetical protein